MQNNQQSYEKYGGRAKHGAVILFFCLRLSVLEGGSTMKKDKKMIVCFLTPALLFFVVMFLYPVCRTIVMSFFQVEGLSDPVSTWKFVGMYNYTELFDTAIFIRSMTNMGKIWFVGGIGVMIISLLFAVILTSGIRAKSFWSHMVCFFSM